MKQLFLRPSHISDLDAIMEVEVASFMPALAFSKEKMQNDLISWPGWVAIFEKKIIGYLILELALPLDVTPHLNWSRISSVAVHPSARKLGVGRALVEAALAHLKLAEIKSCLLEVEALNIPAIRLYESLGFRMVKFLPKWYEDGSDAYRMGVS